MKKLYLRVVLFCCVCFAHGQETYKISDLDIKYLDSVYTQYMDAVQVPGLAVGILKNGKILYSKGFGVKNKNTKTPVTTKSLFHMASVSKTFVATAIMQLCEKQKLNLDDPIVKHLPYFTMKDKRYTHITIKHLLTHTSGIPDVKDYQWDNPEYDATALENYVRTLKKKKLDFEPGQKFQYSNAAFEVLGDVIAKVSKMSFEDYIQENLLDSVQMRNSTFLKPKVPESLATSPHIKKRGKVSVSSIYPYNRAHAPSSTLHSSMEDLLRYASLYLKRGTYEGVEVFSSDSYRELTTKHSTINDNTHMGLSWFLYPFDIGGQNKKRIVHSGRDVGFKSFFVLVPETSFAFILIENGDFTPNDFKLMEIAHGIASKYE